LGLVENVAGISELCTFSIEHNLVKSSLLQTALSFDNAIMVYPTNKLPVALDTKEYLGVQSRETTKVIRPEFKNSLSAVIDIG